MIRVLAVVSLLATAAAHAAPLSTTDFATAVDALASQVDEPVGLRANAQSRLLGLERGDLVIAINGEPAIAGGHGWSGLHLDRAIQTLTVLRGAKELTLTLHLKLDAVTQHLAVDRLTELVDRTRQGGARDYVAATKNGIPSGLLVKQPITYVAAGPHEGDLIRKIDGHVVTTSSDLVKAYEEARDKPQLVLELERSGAPLQITIVLDRPDLALSAAIASIKQVNDITYDVPKAFIDLVLANPMAIMQGARLVPVVKDGKAAGFKLYAVRPGSVYAMLGLNNGDTLQTINGTDITSADKALDASAAFRDTKKVTVVIERRGAKMTMTYMIK